VLTFLFYCAIKAMVKPSNAKTIDKKRRGSDNRIQLKMTTSNRLAADDNAEDDDLATFRISYGYDEERSKNTTPGEWITPGEPIIIKGLRIDGGNFYFGGQLSSLDGYGTEASLVDNSLKIESATIDYEDGSLGYWPKYISLTPKGRGAYISWLSGPRSDPKTPLGYVFIYFYGLERRITVDSIVEKVDDLEFRSIFSELLRLKSVYGVSRSFSRYCTRLIEIMLLLRPDVVSYPELELAPLRDSLLFKYRLATIVNEEKPIPPELALAWIRFSPDYSLKKPARRCSHEFSLMFTRLYVEKYGVGLSVKPNKTRLKLEYHPASPSLRGVALPSRDLPDPSVLTAPVNKLISIAEDCTAQLDSYSRYLAKPGTARSDIEAVLLLPDELGDLYVSKRLEDFKSWANEAISTKNGIVGFEDFWVHTQLPLPSKVNKKEFDLVQNLAERAGFGIAPDARYHHAKLSLNGKLVLFPGGHGKYFQPSRKFYELGVVLRLGAMVAAIDSRIDQNEIRLLTQLIDHETNLSPVEKQSLHAYLIWRLNTPSNLTGLKSRVESLAEAEKSAISRILIKVSMADGKFDAAEIKQLEKFYTLLGLDKAMVAGDIHMISSSKADVGSLKTSSEARSSSSNDFKLDEDILALHESETKDVKGILEAIFVEDDYESDTDEFKPETSIEGEETGIDRLHHTLYQSLIQKDKWERQEVEVFCRELGLMLGGALEIINDWAFEQVDAAVFDEDSGWIYVDKEVVEEIEG